jgi:uncharacterized repeat protein (TIGR01451 family)
MRRSMGLTWRGRLTAALLVMVGAGVFSVGSALADAGNPILNTIRFSAADNGNGTVTIYVRGQYNWLSHNSDCNFDRAATGVGVIWNDLTEPGYTVSKGNISAGVGISSLRAGDTANVVDRMVHPVDRGNVVEGYTGAGTDYPAGQAFVDPPASGAPTDALAAGWRGGCGREPLTSIVSAGTNPERSGKTCGDGTADCNGHPWGSWGYEKNGGRGYSHTYLKSALPSQVCVNFYDVHGGGKLGDKDFQVPNGAKEITVDDNGDNSIETNSFDVANGANCISLPVATVATTIHQSAHGSIAAVVPLTPVHDFVTVTGSRGTPTGNVTIDWFTNGTCSGAPQSNSGNVALDATGHADATGFVRIPSTAGLFAFKAHYLGNGTYIASDGPCEPLRVVDANIQITPATAVNLLGQTHTLTGHVNVSDGGSFVNAPNGTSITFSIVSGPGSFIGPSSCTTTGGSGSCSVQITSTTAGTTTIRASTTVGIAGVSVTRASGDGKAGDSADASKQWAAPSISILKEPKSQTVAQGGTATFTITVTNTGSVTLTDVTVSDPLAPNCNRTKAQLPALASMAPGAKVTYSCTRPNVTAAFDNVATAAGSPPVGPAVTATDSAPVKIAPLKPAAKKKKAAKKKVKVVSHKKPKATG